MLILVHVAAAIWDRTEIIVLRHATLRIVRVSHVTKQSESVTNAPTASGVHNVSINVLQTVPRVQSLMVSV